jgi:fucose permease
MTAASNIRRSDLLVVAIAYAIFVVLGLPEGMLSVAWPSLQETFSVTEGALGTLLLPSSIAFILTSLAVGQLISRFGIAALLIAGCLIRSAGMLGYAISPVWGIVMFAALFHGVGSGLIDAGMNTHFAVNYNERLMNWLHASFGLGATLGPLYMIAVFDLGASWRVGYAIVGLIQAGMVLAIVATASGWRIQPETLEAELAAEPQRAARGLETLRVPGVWLGIAVFFIYAGVEVTASIWGYSLFTEGRGIDAAVASRWIAIYWGMFTLGRLFFGFVAGYWPTTPMVRSVLTLSIASSALLWWNPANWVGFIGIALLGFAMAPVFPLLTSETERRLPRRHALNAIGYQVGAASLGIAVLPGLAGILVERFGVDIVGPYLFGATILIFLLHETIVPRKGRNEKAAIPPAQVR